MKILLIHSPFLPVNIGGNNFGGIENFIDAFTRNNLKYGHTIDLIATEDSTVTSEIQEQYKDTFRLIKTEMSSKTKMAEITGEPKFRFKYEQIIKLVSELGLDNYDLVINNTDKIKISAALWNLSKKLDVHNVVTYLHNLPIFRGSETTVERFLLHSDRVTFVANSLMTERKWNRAAEVVSKVPGTKLVKSMVHLKIDNIVPDGCKDRTKDNTHISDGFTVIGRVCEQKSPVLIKCMSLEMPEYIFDYFGIYYTDDKEYKIFSSIETNSNFRFHDKTPINAKIKRMLESNYPTLSMAQWETFGITAVESFAMGLPVVVMQNNDNNIVNFLSHPIENGMKYAGELPTENLGVGYTICPLGIILKKSSPKVMASKLKEAFEIYREYWFDPQYIINHFLKYFAFTPEFVIDLKAATYVE